MGKIKDLFKKLGEGAREFWKTKSADSYESGEVNENNNEEVIIPINQPADSSADDGISALATEPKPIKRISYIHEIRVITPGLADTNFADTFKLVSDCISQNVTVAINFENTNDEVRQRMLDFINGVIYVLNGNVQAISTYVYIVSPEKINVIGGYADCGDETYDQFANPLMDGAFTKRR